MSGVPSLHELAVEVTFLLSDDFGEDEFDHFSELGSAEKVRHFFLSSDCDAFAVALHRMTGWSIVGLSSPDHGPIHRLIAAPDGRLLDASGWISVHQLKKRYNLKKADLSQPGDERMAIGYTGEVMEGYGSDIGRAVAAIRQFPWGPFDEPDFREISARPFEGVDLEPEAADQAPGTGP